MSSHGFCILCGVNLDQETNYCKTCWHISDDYHSSGGKGKAPEPNKKALLRLLHSQEGMNQIISKENSFLMKELKTFGFGEFGQLLRKIRLKNNITLRQFAKKSNMDSSNLSKIERGFLKPSSNNFNSILKNLNLEESEIEDLKSAFEDCISPKIPALKERILELEKEKEFLLVACGSMKTIARSILSDKFLHERLKGIVEIIIDVNTYYEREK